MPSDQDRLIRYGIPLADPQGLERWREDAERREREFEQERRREERQQQRAREATELETLRNELHAEIATVRAAVDRQSEIHVEALGQVLGEVREKITDYIDQAIRRVENEFWVTIERRFGELMGRIDAIAPDARSRAKGEFRFANEKADDDDGGVVELPNPLRRAIN